MSTYLLCMAATAPQKVNVGALGQVWLLPGCYLYVGSARRNLEHRIRRHLRGDKKRRWHIDYLLNGEALTIEEIWVSRNVSECRLASGLLSLPLVSAPRARLGASDCRCLAHFLRSDQARADLLQHLSALGLSLYFPA